MTKMRLRRVICLPVFLIFLLGGGCAREESEKIHAPDSGEHPEAVSSALPESGITYLVIDEKVSDTPIKTQIEQQIVVSSVPTRAGLEDEIFRRYRSARARRGFRHHNVATNIYIYVYGTKEQANAGQGLWIGMIAMGPLDKEEPRVLISEERLAALSHVPEERFGLSEEERKKVFRESAAAEDRATREAMARVPGSQIMKQIDMERELEEKYKNELVRKYDLTNEQLQEIVVEAAMKGWPY
ncbi:hypothetical protein H0E84_19975 [Luteimonas sp. SJ-92]|uniref:Uncharacterized protein n=1 Tax=Luteimonas salinisoli TaxID=2752307 RepID=A0A853JJG5_9GAMM|nr:hypothetical protein [Luteimonas salinisoli]NZA28657.1 hypothetical protein [Luteimonas salinisoli]